MVINMEVNKCLNNLSSLLIAVRNITVLRYNKWYFTKIKNNCHDA